MTPLGACMQLTINIFVKPDTFKYDLFAFLFKYTLLLVHQHHCINSVFLFWLILIFYLAIIAIGSYYIVYTLVFYFIIVTFINDILSLLEYLFSCESVYNIIYLVPSGFMHPLLQERLSQFENVILFRLLLIAFIQYEMYTLVM